MMKDGVRISGWVSPREREAMEKRAEEEHTSLNLQLRLAIRQFVGIDKPDRQVERV